MIRVFTFLIVLGFVLVFPAARGWAETHPKKEPAASSSTKTAEKPAEKNDASFASSTAAPRPTTLRLEGKLNVNWVGGPKSAYTSFFSADLHNAGSVEAKDIKVIVRLVEGTEVELKGPATLAVNKKATYSYSGTQVATKQPAQAEVKTSCSNCRK